MKKSQRISRIERLSSTEQQIAAQVYASAQREAAAQEGQLRSLQTYQADYLKRLGDGAALHGYEVQKLRVFVQRIEQAITALEQKLRVTHRRCERERLRLIGHKQKVNALHQVATRARSSEVREAENLLQHEIEDLRRVEPPDL